MHEGTGAAHAGLDDVRDATCDRVSVLAAEGIARFVNSVRESDSALLAGSMIVLACPGAEHELERHLSESLRLGARRVVVDLGDTEMLDSSLLTTFKRLAGRLQTNGGELSVVCAQPRLASLLHLTQLSRSFHVFGSLEAALRAT